MGAGKRLRRWARLAVFLIALLCVPAFASAAGCDVEQISIRMPQVRVYYRATQQENSYEAYLGGKALTYRQTARFGDTGEGTDYYFLLDISASIPDDKFANIKSSIIQFATGLGENDHCILLAFGNETHQVLYGTESAAEIESAVGSLQNEDMETVLFQAIVQAANMIDQEAQTADKRRIIVAITDGEDCVTGQATAAEAQKTLQEKGIPLYAVAVDVGKEEYTNSFGEFARSSGGMISLYSEGECMDILTGIRRTILDSFVADFQSDSNVVSNVREDFTVKFLEHQVTTTREVVPTRWTADTEVPRILSAETQGDQKIKLTFSEPVLGAGDQANYRVMLDEESVAVDSVSYVENNGEPSAVLTFNEPMYTGQYLIVLSNVTDASMEKNALTEQVQKDVKGVEKENAILQKFREWWWLLLILVLVVMIAVIAVIVSAYKKVKKNKGVIYVDGKVVLASDVDVKQHVSTSNMPTMRIKLNVRDRINGKCTLDATVNGSLMVGRSGDCDIYFDDGKMSKQHFALETDGTNLFITDLESTNGTSVNGVRLNQRRKLEPGDEIAAGGTLMRIVW